MSARRELLALWSGCDRLRARVGPRVTPGPETSPLLDAACAELGAALRRLSSAGMLTLDGTRDLEDALAGLLASRDGRLSPATAIARYGLALQEVAAGFRITLTSSQDVRGSGSRDNPGNGAAALEPRPAQVGGEVVETLAFVTSVATRGGHRLGGFSATGSGPLYRLSARCAGCGELVSVQRHAGAWSFTPVVRCARTEPVPAAT